jgi:hypothetical protein
MKGFIFPVEITGGNAWIFSNESTSGDVLAVGPEAVLPRLMQRAEQRATRNARADRRARAKDRILVARFFHPGENTLIEWMDGHGTIIHSVLLAGYVTRAKVASTRVGREILEIDRTPMSYLPTTPEAWSDYPYRNSMWATLVAYANL